MSMITVERHLLTMISWVQCLTGVLLQEVVQVRVVDPVGQVGRVSRVIVSEIFEEKVKESGVEKYSNYLTITPYRTAIRICRAAVSTVNFT